MYVLDFFNDNHTPRIDLNHRDLTQHLNRFGVDAIRRQLKRTEVPEGGHPTDNTWVRPHSAHPSRTLPSGVAPGTTRPKSAMVVPNEADQPKSGSGLSWMELQEDTKSVRSVSTEVATQTGGELLIDYDPVSQLDVAQQSTSILVSVLLSSSMWHDLYTHHSYNYLVIGI